MSHPSFYMSPVSPELWVAVNLDKSESLTFDTPPSYSDLPPEWEGDRVRISAKPPMNAENRNRALLETYGSAKLKAVSAHAIDLDFSALADAIHEEECAEIRERNVRKNYAPGCGRKFPLLWCPSEMRCGAILTGFDGNKKKQFCENCQDKSET